jgi:hypothetical protein
MRRHICDHPRGWAIASWIVLVLLATGTAFAQQPATREITGTIVDGDGTPVANATVAVTGGGPSTTTGPDGTFKLPKVAAANLTIEITAEGFTARQITVLGARTALQLQVTVVRPPPPTPPPTRTIGGIVTDGDRAPIAGATVKLRGTELVATTAADGTFSLAGVAPGVVTLVFVAPGKGAGSVSFSEEKLSVVVSIG